MALCWRFPVASPVAASRGAPPVTSPLRVGRSFVARRPDDLLLPLLFLDFSMAPSCSAVSSGEPAALSTSSILSSRLTAGQVTSSHRAGAW